MKLKSYSGDYCGGSSNISVNGMNVSIRDGRIYVNNVEYVPIDGSTIDRSTHANMTKPEPAEPISVKLERDSTVNGNIDADVTFNTTGYMHLFIKGNINGDIKINGNNSMIECSVINGDIRSDGELNISANTINGDIKGAYIK